MDKINQLIEHALKINSCIKELGLSHETLALKKTRSKNFVAKLIEEAKARGHRVELTEFSGKLIFRNCTVSIIIH